MLFHESRSQVIKQLRMAGLVGHVAKVIRGANQAFAEVMHPDAIDRHPCGEGIGWRSDGLCEVQAARPV